MSACGALCHALLVWSFFCNWQSKSSRCCQLTWQWGCSYVFGPDSFVVHHHVCYRYHTTFIFEVKLVNTLVYSYYSYCSCNTCDIWWHHKCCLKTVCLLCGSHQLVYHFDAIWALLPWCMHTQRANWAISKPRLRSKLKMAISTGKKSSNIFSCYRGAALKSDLIS